MVGIEGEQGGYATPKSATLSTTLFWVEGGYDLAGSRKTFIFHSLK